jgi:hypothetical protein
MGGFPAGIVAEAVEKAPSNAGHRAGIVSQPAACQPDERLEASPPQFLSGVCVASLQVSDPTRDRTFTVSRQSSPRSPLPCSREDFTKVYTAKIRGDDWQFEVEILGRTKDRRRPCNRNHRGSSEHERDVHPARTHGPPKPIEPARLAMPAAAHSLIHPRLLPVG